ncbi:MAG: heparinase II/III family protein [Prolixibacteraceae bacterium]
MRKYNLMVIVFLLCTSIFAQKRDYLLYTDANMARLKVQIQKNQEVKQAWDHLQNKVVGFMQKERNAIAEVQELGLVYRMTGEEKYARRIKETLLREICREEWEGGELKQRTPPWNAGLGAANATFNSSLGFDCIYQYLSPTERKQIAEKIVSLGISPIMGDWVNDPTRIHTIDTMGHNWWSACVDMAGFAALAVRSEIPEAKEWIDEVSEASVEWFNYSGNVLQNKIPTFDRNGGFWESINYANFGFSQYLIFRLAHQNVYPKVKMAEIPQMEPMADFFIHTTYFSSEGTFSVNFGDGSIHGTGRACVLLLWNLGFQKDRYAWFLNKTIQGNNKEWMTLDSPLGLVLNPDLPKTVEKTMPGLSTSKLLPDMGWATIRDSWKDNATLLAVKSGLTWNHSHADAGSYILFHNGKNLIIDSGNCWYGNPLYTEYYCQSEAHNVVMFNGQGQERKDPYFGSVNHGSLLNLIDADGLRYLMANATGPYSRILSRNYRSFLWVGDVILVIDDLLAYQPGKFEWLLHYNGESKRNGLNLSVEQGDAEVIVRPLYPETFPDGGLPHDFPEKMRLDERMGYEDHHPENKVPYWSISHFQDTDRTKFVTAIILKNDQNKDKLPIIERFDGKDFLGVRIKQNGKVSEIFLNLLADGRIMHRNSIINMNGWETDAYLTVLTFPEGADLIKPENLKQMFIGNGSYLRRDGKSLIHALSKYFAVVDFEGTDLKIQFQGQPTVKFHLAAQKNPTSILLNGAKQKVVFNPATKFIELEINDPK